MYFCREIVKVGDWDYLKGLNWSPSVTEKEDTQGIYEFLKICIKNIHLKKLLVGIPMLRVVTRIEPPYVMTCKNCSSGSGYQGFAIDLLDAISKVELFSWKTSSNKDHLEVE